MIAYCLADFFNLQLFPTGREPSFLDIQDGLSDLVRATVEACPSAKEVALRLYGGWHGDVPETRITLRDLTARVADRYPRGRDPRLRIELAETPIWNRAVRLLRTVQEWSLTHISASVASTARTCSRPSSCMISHLMAWKRGRCPDTDCPVRLADVATTTNQKMVDTLLTVDAMTIIAEDIADAVLIASDDEDMIPALLALSRSDKQVVLLSRGSGMPDYYAGMLELDGMTTFIW